MKKMLLKSNWCDIKNIKEKKKKLLKSTDWCDIKK
jgi:hypothetical protein